MSEEAALLLDKAADEIDKNGWKQHDRGTIDGPKCAWGSLIFCRTGKMWTPTSGVTALDDPVLSECWFAASREIGRAAGSLVAYNDAVAPEKRYVTRLLRRLARKMRAAL